MRNKLVESACFSVVGWLDKKSKRDKVIYFSGVGYYLPEEEDGNLVFRRVAEEIVSNVPDSAIKIVSFNECFERFDAVFEVL